jgi:membrane-bound serine protease (ClpP class)
MLAALAVVALTTASGYGLIAGQDGPAIRPGGAIYRVPVHGVIELGLAPFVERSIREAEEHGARAVILDIETPGGRIDAAERIVDALKDADVPVYAFVDRRAFSAGALIALATDRIYIRPGGVIGAATPVVGDGKKASEKIVSAMRSEMRALAEDHGLDPRVAEAMVDEDVEIDGVVEAGKLLTLTSEEAVRIGYASPVEDWDALVRELDLADAPVHVTSVNWAEGLVRFLTHPAVAPMLLSLGFLGLIIEIKTPAFGIAGTAGILALGAFFGSHWLIGLAGMEEMLLLGGGLILIALEAFVFPGFGIAGILGMLGVGSSIYLSMVSHMSSAADLTTAAGTIAVSALAILVIGWALLRHLPRSTRFGKSGIMLPDATSRETGYLSSAVRDELVGATGIALTDLRPAGAARVGEERLDVVADSDWIPAGTPVRVVRAEGYRHVVVKA